MTSGTAQSAVMSPVLDYYVSNHAAVRRRQHTGVLVSP